MKESNQPSKEEQTTGPIPDVELVIPPHKPELKQSDFDAVIAQTPRKRLVIDETP